MNAVVLSRWFTGSASSKEGQSAIAYARIQCLSGVFGPVPEAKPGDQSWPHHPVAHKPAADQVRLASLMAVVLRG
jgi:hypothetical protein